MGPPTLSKEKWIGVLRLSRQWDMPEVCFIAWVHLSNIRVSSQVSALAIEKLNSITLTAVEKVRLGKAHGVPGWLKGGYASLVGDMLATSLEELHSLGLETANRVLWAQIQSHRLVKDDTLYCGYCLQYRRARYKLERQETSLPESHSYKCEGYSCMPFEDGYGAFNAVGSPPSKTNATSSSVSAKVLEVFRDEIEEAERRNTSSMCD
ncbi:hypothetical protein NMY22_g6023 [Coprinellus aureogranulatus]|nr:hypothetical protein NMY22_g6023 [Coprinellus aureogranulatus]